MQKVAPEACIVAQSEAIVSWLKPWNLIQTTHLELLLKIPLKTNQQTIMFYGNNYDAY